MPERSVHIAGKPWDRLGHVNSHCLGLGTKDGTDPGDGAECALIPEVLGEGPSK